MAGRLGISQPTLSRFLRGKLPWPAGLEKKALAELARLEAAERAANKARELSLSASEGRGVGLWALVSWNVLGWLRRATNEARRTRPGEDRMSREVAPAVAAINPGVISRR